MAVKHEEVFGTEVLGVKASRLTELKERVCTLEELQAALVQLIEITNANGVENRKLAARVDNKADREWRATI